MSSKDYAELKKKLAAANWMVEEQQRLVDKNAANLKASQAELQKYVELAKAAELELDKAKPLGDRDLRMLRDMKTATEVPYTNKAVMARAQKLARLGWVTMMSSGMTYTAVLTTDAGRTKLEEANLAAKFKKAAK